MPLDFYDMVGFKIKGYETVVLSLLKYTFDVSVSQQQFLNQEIFIRMMTTTLLKI